MLEKIKIDLHAYFVVYCKKLFEMLATPIMYTQTDHNALNNREHEDFLDALY